MSVAGQMRFWSLGSEPLSYQSVWDFQKDLVEKRARDEIPDTFLFLEHQSVVTRGRGLQFTGQSRERAMPLQGLPPEVEYQEIERGGDLTWHGPGQLVLYPIVKLDGLGFSELHDVTAYLRRLERATIELHSRLGLSAESRENATGVWVGGRKTTSIGIAVRRWVTYHGAAMNVVNPLKVYRSFSPCGYAPEVMARLIDLAPDRVPAVDWRPTLERLWTECLTASALKASHEPRVQAGDLVNGSFQER